MTAGGGERWATWANVVTAVRLVAGLAIFAYAAVTRSEAWNFIGLGVYWVLDVVDGFLARRLDQETRIGAQLDILADRLLVAFFYLNYVALYPVLIVPVALFLFQFMGIDHYLSNQFMRWPIKSPNYFHQVDRAIWAWNWSPAGKLLNSAVVTAVLVLTKDPIIGSIVCGAIIALKVWSAVLLARLPAPEAGWAALRASPAPAPHHSPALGIDAQGSAAGSAAPRWSSSTEI
jgi:CDP-diacylglycerol---glycerol-3-phosphate 3-phosphatidyltransferase